MFIHPGMHFPSLQVLKQCLKSTLRAWCMVWRSRPSCDSSVAEDVNDIHWLKWCINYFVYKSCYIGFMKISCISSIILIISVFGNDYFWSIATVSWGLVGKSWTTDRTNESLQQWVSHAKCYWNSCETPPCIPIYCNYVSECTQLYSLKLRLWKAEATVHCIAS